MSKFMTEFKEFIARGNVMDMAVGVIVGAAFTDIVTSLVENIITPAIKMLTGAVAGTGTDVESAAAALKWIVPGTEGEAAEYLDLGAFIGAVVNFLIIAFVVFCMVKAVNKMRDAMDAAMKKDVAEEAPAAAPVCPHCLEEVKAGATRCPHCGGEIHAAEAK